MIFNINFLLLVCVSFSAVLGTNTREHAKLNTVERFCAIGNDPKTQSQTKASVAATFRLKLSKGQKFVPDMLREAVHHVVATTYRLHCRVSADGKYTSPYADTLGELPIDFSYYDRPKGWSPEDKAKALEQEMNLYLNGLRWRMVAIGEQNKDYAEVDLIIIADHVLTDGFGCVPVLQNIKKRLEHNVKVKDPRQYAVPRDTPLTGEPPQEFETKFNIPFWEWPIFLRTAWDYCQTALGPEAGRWSGDNLEELDGTRIEHSVEPLKSQASQKSWYSGAYSLNRGNILYNRVMVLKMPNERVAEIKDVGREHKSTLTSTLTAAGLVAHRHLSYVKKQRTSKCQGVSIAMDIRFAGDPPVTPNVVGNFFFGCDVVNFCYDHRISFWKVASKVKNQVINAKAWYRKHALKTLQWISPIAEAKQKNRKAKDFRHTSVMLSSMNLDMTSYKGVSLGVEPLNSDMTTVLDVIGTSSTHWKGSNSLFPITVVTVNGVTNIVFSYHASLVSDEDAKEFKSKFDEILSEVVKGSPSVGQLIK